MNIQTIKRTSRTRSPLRDCCDDKCPVGARNHYFLGKRLTPDSYRLEQSYGIERRRLINRAIHGWGVVYGFGLAIAGGDKTSRLEAGELQVKEGFALDQLGRELIQTRDIALTIDNLLILDGDGKPVWAKGPDLDERLEGFSHNPEHCWRLSAHYAEQTIGPVDLKDPCSCDRREWDQICETIVYSIERIDCDDCCVPWKCTLHCCCTPDTLCCEERKASRDEIVSEQRSLREEFAKRIEEADDEPELIAKLRADYERRLKELEKRHRPIDEQVHPRGGCACLCQHLTGLELGDDCVRLTDIGDCIRADLAHGVPLACLQLARDKCDHWAISTIVDACGPRRLVKRNDLLFDLINGCDLTRIIEIGWAPWRFTEDKVPFHDFVEALGWQDSKGDPYEEYTTRDFWVRFSRPVRIDTLKPDAFQMIVMSDHGDDFWRRSYRVPVVAIDTGRIPAEQDDPPNYVRSARLVVGGLWLHNSVTDNDTIFAQGETFVEIWFHGDLVEDCLGQTVDANARGRALLPSGNGGPGDSLLSSFTVARRDPPKIVEASPARQGRRSTPTAS